MLFRWFVGLSVDEPVWDHSTFSKNRDRLLEADIARELFEAIVERARMAGLLSDEHFSVACTMIGKQCAWPVVFSGPLRETVHPFGGLSATHPDQTLGPSDRLFPRSWTMITHN